MPVREMGVPMADPEMSRFSTELSPTALRDPKPNTEDVEVSVVAVILRTVGAKTMLRPVFKSSTVEVAVPLTVGGKGELALEVKTPVPTCRDARIRSRLAFSERI